MTFGWILGGLAGLAILAIVARGRHYARLFSTAHLAELARATLALRRQAQGAPIESGALPPHAVTSSGLAVVCTRTVDGDGARYHLSLSHQTGALAHGGALTLLAFALDALAVAPDEVTVTQSTTVTHAQFRRTPEQERALDAAADAELGLDEADVRARLGRALSARQRFLRSAEQ